MKKQKSGSLVVRNGKVLLADGRISRADIIIADGRIRKIGRARAGEYKQAEVINAAGKYVLPGFIDLHTHGIGYESYTSSLKAYAAKEAGRGTTTFYPTLFGSIDFICSHLRRNMAETRDLEEVPQVGGFRLESPYLAKTGAGREQDLAKITQANTSRLLEAGGGRIKIWDVSPELKNACETIRLLSRQGILCSMAHTNATIEQARAAVKAGARLVTHLFDTFAPPPVTDPGVYPVSLTDYFLLEDGVACEIIADGTHVHPLLVQLALRCKPEDKVAFVTDSNYGAGLPPGVYLLPTSCRKATIRGPNDGVRLVSRLRGLSGSALTPLDAFRNAIRMFGQGIPAASRLCSRNPARIMGLKKGEIRKGFDADFVILTPALDITHTIVGGNVIYKKSAR